MGEIRRKLSPNGYFAKIYLLLVSFILVPLLILGLIYLLIMSINSYQNFCNEQLLKINDMKNTTEARLSDIEDDLVSLGMSGPDRNPDYASRELLFHDISKALASFNRGHSDFVVSSYYLDRMDLVVLYPGHGVFNLVQFYDTDWIQTIDYRPLLRKLPVRKNINRLLSDNDYFVETHPAEEVITLLYGSSYSNVYVTNIGLKNLQQNILKGYYSGNPDIDFSLHGSENCTFLSATSVADASDEVSYYRKNGHIYFTGTIYHNLLSFEVSFSASEVFSVSRSYFIYYLLISVTLAVLLIILARYAARTLYTPVGTLYETVRAHGNNGHFSIDTDSDELSVLRQAFEDMNADREASIKAIALYKSAEASASLGMLLESNLTPDKFRECNPDSASKSSFRLFLVSSESDFDTRAEYISNLSELLRIYMGSSENIIVTLLSRSRIGILIGADSDKELEEYFIKLTGALNAVVPNTAHACGSDILHSIDLLPEAYRSCLDLIGRAEFFRISNNILTSATTIFDTADASIDSSVTYEAGLIRAVIGNNRDEYVQIISTLCESLSCHSVAYAKNSLTKIMSSLENELKLSAKLGYDIVTDSASLSDIEAYREYMISILDSACALYNSGNGIESKYCADAKAYLEAHYTTDIDVLSVAAALDLSYPYLSKIFKNAYNVTLSDYLNSYRIKKSCELLRDTSQTLEVIAAQVGYNNAQSFQRFFKKYKEMTPTEYRKSVQVKFPDQNK